APAAVRERLLERVEPDILHAVVSSVGRPHGRGEFPPGLFAPSGDGFGDLLAQGTGEPGAHATAPHPRGRPCRLFSGSPSVRCCCPAAGAVATLRRVEVAMVQASGRPSTGRAGRPNRSELPQPPFLVCPARW